MPKIINLQQYRRAKKRKPELESYLKGLEKLSDFLYNNLTFKPSFDILESVENARIQYYMELHEINRILNQEKLIIKLKGKNDET